MPPVNKPERFSEKIIDRDLEEDKKWISYMENNPHAFTLVKHIASIHSKITFTSDFLETPFTQTQTWRRVLCEAYKHSDEPLGFPLGQDRCDSTPNVIAICNLSGEICKYYSKKWTLLRMLCIERVLGNMDMDHSIYLMMNFAQSNNCTVVVYFSIPFQIGIDAAYWEARTLRKDTMGNVIDGEMMVTINDHSLRKASNTTDCETMPSADLKTLSSSMNVMFPVVNLDDVSHMEGETSYLNRIEKLERATAIYKEGRQQLLEKHKKEIDNMNDMLQQIEEASNERIQDMAKSTENVKRLYDDKVTALQEQNEMLKEQMHALKVSLASARNEALSSSSSNDTMKEEIKTLTTENKRLTKSLNNTLYNQKSKIALVEKSHEEKMDEMRRTFKEQNDKQDSVFKDLIKEHDHRAEQAMKSLRKHQDECEHTKTMIVANAIKYAIRLKVERNNTDVKLCTLKSTLFKEIQAMEESITESTKQMKQQDHLLDQMKQRMAYLEGRCHELESISSVVQERERREKLKEAPGSPTTNGESDNGEVEMYVSRSEYRQDVHSIRCFMERISHQIYDLQHGDMYDGSLEYYNSPGYHEATTSPPRGMQSPIPQYNKWKLQQPHAHQPLPLQQQQCYYYRN